MVAHYCIIVATYRMDSIGHRTQHTKVHIYKSSFAQLNATKYILHVNELPLLYLNPAYGALCQPLGTAGAATHVTARLENAVTPSGHANCRQKREVTEGVILMALETTLRMLIA